MRADRPWVVWRDVFSASSQLVAAVTKVGTYEASSTFGRSDTHCVITVAEQEFEVRKKIYAWLVEGEEVVVSYWPHTKTVSRMDKAGAQEPLSNTL